MADEGWQMADVEKKAQESQKGETATMGKGLCDKGKRLNLRFQVSSFRFLAA